LPPGLAASDHDIVPEAFDRRHEPAAISSFNRPEEGCSTLVNPLGGMPFAAALGAGRGEAYP